MLMITPLTRCVLCLSRAVVPLDNATKSTVQSIPLLSVRAGPRVGDQWIARLKQELTSLIGHSLTSPNAAAVRLLWLKTSDTHSLVAVSAVAVTAACSHSLCKQQQEAGQRLVHHRAKQAWHEVSGCNAMRGGRRGSSDAGRIQFG